MTRGKKVRDEERRGPLTVKGKGGDAGRGAQPTSRLQMPRPQKANAFHSLPSQTLRTDFAFARVCREPTLKYALRALPGVVHLPNPEVCNVGRGGVMPP